MPPQPLSSGFPQAPGFSTQQVLFPQSIQEQSLHQGSDPNSPEAFKHNIQLVQAHVGRLQSLARSAVEGMSEPCNSTNPTQTDGTPSNTFLQSNLTSRSFAHFSPRSRHCDFEASTLTLKRHDASHGRRSFATHTTANRN